MSETAGQNNADAPDKAPTPATSEKERPSAEEPKRHSFLEWLQGFIAIGSLATAVVAIWIGLQVEERNQKRFEEQLEQSSDVASAAIRPLLYVHSQVYLDQKAIILSNRGVGAAVITAFKFTREGETSNTLAELFDFGRQIIWDDFHRFGPQSILAAGEDIVLVRLTLSGLVDQGLSLETAEAILAQFDLQKKKIDIRFEYQDLLDKPQDPEIW